MTSSSPFCVQKGRMHRSIQRPLAEEISSYPFLSPKSFETRGGKYTAAIGEYSTISKKKKASELSGILRHQSFSLWGFTVHHQASLCRHSSFYGLSYVQDESVLDSLDIHPEIFLGTSDGPSCTAGELRALFMHIAKECLSLYVPKKMKKYVSVILGSLTILPTWRERLKG